jgi:hypothetical protein
MAAPIAAMHRKAARIAAAIKYGAFRSSLPAMSRNFGFVTW